MWEVGLEFVALDSILQFPRFSVRVRLWVRLTLTLTLTLNLPQPLPLLTRNKSNPKLQTRSQLHTLIYLTSITQKAHRTYKRVLEGADVGVLWPYVWKKLEHLEETTHIGRATTTLLHADSRAEAVTSDGFTPALSRYFSCDKLW